METNQRKKFAQAVKQLRANKSTREFGKILGVSHAIIRAWENPEIDVEPEPKNIERIALLRGETLEEFMNLLTSPDPLPDPFERLLEQIQSQLPVLCDTQIAQLLRILADYLDSK